MTDDITYFLYTFIIQYILYLEVVIGDFVSVSFYTGLSVMYVLCEHDRYADINGQQYFVVRVTVLHTQYRCYARILQ